MTAPQVFVSYSDSDGQTIASALDYTLTASGCSVWRYHKNLRLGDASPAVTHDALIRADAVVFVVTPQSLARHATEDEVNEVIYLRWMSDRPPKIFAVLYGVDLSSLRTLPFMDFRWARIVETAQDAERVGTELATILATPGKPEASPKIVCLAWIERRLACRNCREKDAVVDYGHAWRCLECGRGGSDPWVQFEYEVPIPVEQLTPDFIRQLAS